MRRHPKCNSVVDLISRQQRPTQFVSASMLRSNEIGKELDRFLSVLNTVDTNKDGKISESEFMIACKKGELKNVQL